MNAEQKELFRMALLRVFGANKTRFGLGLPAVGHLVVMFGFSSPSVDDTSDALDYLTRKQFIEEVPKPISPENRVWRITQAGLAFLDERS